MSDLASLALALDDRQRGMVQPRSPEDSLNLVLFGPPGAGKGTQADRFSQAHHVPKISTGEILRCAVQAGTALGQAVKETLERGALVGDDLMIQIVRARLLEDDTMKGFVLDGFPRTIHQAATLDAILEDRGPIIVVALVVHADEVVKRLSTRGRHDDAERIIRERLEVYTNETAPVIEFYRRRRMITVLDGNRPPDSVTESIEAAVAKAVESHRAR